MKFVSVLSIIFIVGSIGFNVYLLACGLELNWGFSGGANRFTPDIVSHFNNATLDLYIGIPAYVNNTAVIGQNVNNLGFKIGYYNNSGLVTGNSSIVGNIPFHDSKMFNITVVDANALTLAKSLNSTPVTINIQFTVGYLYSMTFVNVNITLPGGLTFT